MSKSGNYKPTTKLIHEGRSPSRFNGAVNPPIQRASTILSPTAWGLYSSSKSLYGRMGTDVHQVLIEGLKALENAQSVQLAPNGLSACSLAIAASVKAGDHILINDAAYGPTRRFSERFLSKMGVEASYFHPRTGADEFKALIRDNTTAAFLEMPGSLTFELHDLPELLAVCKAAGITTILDNTWSAGVFLKPLDMGVDISVQALTKYVIGHSDGFGGAALTNNAKLARELEAIAQDWGLSMSPDDAYLAQRGLRTLTVRLKEQGSSALALAEWLEHQPQIAHVFHPALPSHQDHAIWQRDFSGASGLFSFSLKTTDPDQLERFYSALNLFGFGFSWGGFESLLIPCDPQLKRNASDEWKNRQQGSLMRVSIGLEDIEDLKSELKNALSEIQT